MKDRQPETSQQHVAQIQCDAADLHALLLMCAAGTGDVESSRAMNAAAVLANRVAERAALVWDQLGNCAAAGAV